MDRLFVLQESYIEGKHNFEGQMISFAMADLIARNLDEYCIVNDECTNLDILKYQDAYKGKDLSKKKIIPIGTIEFVQNWLGNRKMIPIEIPAVLRPYLKREYRIDKGYNLTEEDCNPEKHFIKDIDTLKKFNSQLCFTTKQVQEHIDPDTRYSISDYVEFDSEWRIFVYEDEALGCECYSGDPLCFPNKYIVKNMISAYSFVHHPSAYTLDVGMRWIRLSDNKMFAPPSYEAVEPIEIHPFVSVGLYGFYDKKLLDMYEKGFDWYRED